MNMLRSVIGAVCLLAMTTLSRAEAYRLTPGDSIEVSVSGVPELRQRYTLDVDGRISMSLVGEMTIAGMTLDEVRAQLQKVLPTKVLRQTTSAGTESQRVIEADEIAVNIADYNPVYLNGDVARPGEQRFRPNMTVRQVVALAGGYDIMRYRMSDPYTQAADFKAEYENLWIELAQQRAKLARLRAELGIGPDLTIDAFGDAPVPKKTAEQILSVEQQQLAARKADRDKEQAFLQRAIKNTSDQIAVLTDQREKEKEGVQSDTNELNRLQEFSDRGTVTTNRVVDARRNALISSTRLLQTIAQTAQATREKEDLMRRLERLDDTRRMQLLQEVQDTQARIATIQTRIRAVGDKLLYASAVRTQVARGRGGSPEISIVRKTKTGVETIEATEDTIVRPGDVVEVALKIEPTIGLPVQ